jgi:hypothetical protein
VSGVIMARRGQGNVWMKEYKVAKVDVRFEHCTLGISAVGAEPTNL